MTTQSMIRIVFMIGVAAAYNVGTYILNFLIKYCIRTGMIESFRSSFSTTAPSGDINTGFKQNLLSSFALKIKKAPATDGMHFITTCVTVNKEQKIKAITAIIGAMLRVSRFLTHSETLSSYLY